MLTAARQTSGKVAAWEVERSDGPFLCFCCQQIALLRKGEIKILDYLLARGFVQADEHDGDDLNQELLETNQELLETNQELLETARQVSS